MPKPGLVTGTTIQLINPKAYAVHITLFSGFVFYPNDFFIETAIKLLIANVIWILIHFLWLYLGVKINQLELLENTQRVINVFMAICLLAVVGLSVWSIIS
jgi:threonine/homoserine/homoserine lactone efflux protein